MRFYLVRHGEATHNVERVFSRELPQLTPTGVGQVRHLKERLGKDVLFDMVISSDYVRAIQTAEILIEGSGLEIRKTQLLRERLAPQEVQGLNFDSSAVEAIFAEMELHRDDPDYRYSDEETFRMLMQRAKESCAYMLSTGGENVLVVTHGIFLMYLIAYMILGEGITTQEFDRIRNFIDFYNGGVSIVEYKSDAWKLVTLNNITCM
jgi:broad specificity phosphatase PhoE